MLAIYCDEDKTRRAGPGENVRIRLSGIEDEDILSGFILSSVGMLFPFLFWFPFLVDITLLYGCKINIIINSY